MQKSEGIGKLSSALVKAIAEIRNTPASKENPHFRSRYTPLDDVLDSVRPILASHGLSALQSVSGASDTISVTTMILHESGEWIESDALTMKAEKMTPQGQGSAITYARRYSLSGILGIATDPDDDGNEAGKPAEKPPEKPINKPQEKPQKSDTINKAQIMELTRECMLPDGSPDVKQIERLRTVYNRYGYHDAKDILQKDFEHIKREFIECALPYSLTGGIA